MARINTSKALVGKTVTLLDGEKVKITEAIASGYNVEGRSKRIATRCICLDGKAFKEIERLPLSELNVEDGYVTMKDAKAAKKSDKKDEKQKAKKPGQSVKPEAKEKSGKVQRKKPAKAEDDESESDADPVRITEVTEALATAITERLTCYAKTTAALDELQNLIDNSFTVKHGTEFSDNGIQVTIAIEYDVTPVEEENETESRPEVVEIDADLMKKAKKRIGKKVGKKLAKAIKSNYDLDELVIGTKLDKDGEEVIVLGPDAEDADILVVFVTETEKFRKIGAGNLSKYELVMEEVEAESDSDDFEEDEDDTDSDEDDNDDSDDTDNDDSDDNGSADDADDAEGMIISLDDEDLEGLDKKATAKFFRKMSEKTGVEITYGSVVTDGEDKMALVGINEDGGLHFKYVDADDNDLYSFDEDDLADVLKMTAVMDEAEASDELNEDFDLDFTDMDEETLRNYVIEQELVKENRAKRMNKKQLLKLVSE